MVNNHACRLIDHLLAGRTNLEAQVGILVISWTITLIEAAKLMEIIAPDGQAGAGDIIGLTEELVLRQGRIVTAPVVPAATVVENDAAGFLKTAVRIDQSRSDNAGLRITLERCDQRFQPARSHRGVVVQKDQVLARRGRRSTIAGVDETGILGVA